MSDRINDYKSNIWKLYFFQFLLGFHFFSGVLIPFFTLWGGLTLSQVMILESIFMFSLFLFETPTGAIADRFGRKISIMLASVFFTIGFLVYASYPNFYVFALAEAILGLSVSLISGANEALAYDTLKKIKKEKESKRIFKNFETAYLLAILISAPIGGFLAYYIGMREIMLASAIPSFIGIFVALSIKEPDFVVKKKEKKGYFKILSSGINYFRKHTVLKYLAFDAITIALIVYYIIWLYQPKLMAFNLPIVYFGIVHSLIVIAELLVLSRMAYFEKLTGKKNYLFFSSLIVGVGFILLAITRNVYVAIALILIVGGVGLTRKTLFNSYYNKYIDSKNRATVLSTISMTQRFFQGIF
ncbi:MAG: MFS transporter, partial [Nanoarchaeota archaeon]|nr:MFS transporter [Nanoarchaeota archaeon]